MDFIKENIGIILFIVFMILIVWFFVKASIQDRENRKRLMQELEEPYVEPQTFEYKAIVVEKYYAKKNLGGVKMPQTYEYCCAVFQTQDGKLWESEVSLKEFSQLEQNQAVVIAVADNKVIGFYSE